jgi:Fe2+/Zn2+ uptake regulation proteins
MEKRTRTRETRQRRLVLKTLRATKSHPTAEWLFEQVRREMPTISLGTVYRNLNILRDEGRIRELRVAGRTARWDADLSPHGHFVCTSCGEIRDVTGLKPHDWRDLKDLVGCEVTHQRTEFYGLCPGCLARERRVS